MSSLRKLLLPAALTLILAACGKDEAPPATTGAAPTTTAAPVAANAGPAETAATVAKALKAGDLNTLVKTMIPAEQYAKAKAEFEKNLAEKPITDEERKEFADNLAKISGPGAVDALMAQAEPMLEMMKPQLSGQIAAGLGFIQMSIPENKDLTEAQKAQALAMINGVQGWAMKTDFADAGKLRAALTDISEAVAATGVTSLDQIKAMKFEDALAKGSIMFVGVKKALNQYGLNIDEIADTMKVEVLSQTGDVAKVKTSFSFFGAPISAESEMVKVDGGWYGKDTLDSLNKVAAESSSDADEGEGEEGSEEAGTPAE